MMVPSWILKHYLPPVVKMLHYVPSQRLRDFLISGDKVYEVSLFVTRT